METRQLIYNITADLTELSGVVIISNRNIESGDELDFAYRKEYFDKKCKEEGGTDWIFKHPNIDGKAYCAITQESYDFYVSGKSSTTSFDLPDDTKISILELLTSGKEHLIAIYGISNGGFLTDIAGDIVMKKFGIYRAVSSWDHVNQYSQFAKIKDLANKARTHTQTLHDVRLDFDNESLEFTFLPKDRNEFNQIVEDTSNIKYGHEEPENFIMKEILGWE